MKITCPNCRRVYNVDSAKIPPGAASAQCKACGHAMPLSTRQKAAAMPTAKSPIQTIVCQYCSQKYRINPAKIPAAVSTVKCTACGHAISLSSVGSPVPSGKTGERQQISCPYCSQKYRINPAKIPAGVSTVKCKACGHSISLQPKYSKILPPKAAPKTTDVRKGSAAAKPVAGGALVSRAGAAPTVSGVSLWRRSWVLAAAAGIIGIILVGYFAEPYLTKFFSAPPASVPKAASRPALAYINLNAQALSNLKVKWQEADAQSWADTLAVDLPGGPVSGRADWEVHFFQQDRPLYLTGDSSFSGDRAVFSLRRGELKKAHAAFGKVRFTLATDIQRLSFVKKAGTQPPEKSRLGAPALAVSFDRNQISYRAVPERIVQVMAYDAAGRRLKQDGFVRSEKGRRMLYFWGQPAKFVVDVAGRSIQKTIAFDIRRRPVVEKAYREFKKEVANQRVVVNILKDVARALSRDHSSDGEDLAHLYYLYDSRRKKPLKLIDQKIAHSDPAGKQRFGYRLKAFRGYYFTVLAGTESKGQKKDYPRGSKKRSFVWQKGRFQSRPFLQRPAVAALPADKSRPTFFLQGGQVFMKPLNGAPLKYLPNDYYNKGWVEVKFVRD